MTHPLNRAVKAYDIRGVAGQDLDAAAARALGIAVAEVTAAPGVTGLVVGHDMRESSPDLAAALAEGATAAGVPVELIGLCSTDQLYLVSGLRNAPGVMITASHNPARYNGMKICRAGARPVALDTGLADIRDRAIALLTGTVPPATGIAATTRTDTLAEYAGHLRSLVPLDGIRPLRVVVDAGNGMAGLTTPAVLSTAAGLPVLPVELVGLYLELDGTFPNHEANPLDPTTLVDLQAAVREHGADLGLAFDGDADRCFVVDQAGEPVDPGAVAALVARREIARTRAAGEDRPTILHNLITSWVVPDVVTEDGGQAVRTRVGHSYIKAEMARTGAVFGGEHSAHYYFRDFFGADSGMLAALHVLAALGESPAGTPLSALVDPYRRYHRSGEINSTVADTGTSLRQVTAHAAAHHPAASLDTLDGVTVVAPDRSWWANIRPSNTEPLLRLNVEAGDEGVMSTVRDEFLDVIRTGNGRA
ncbi:MAG: phosphomannomutase/phosphoglucomutase [Kineosporiaceae bacterium]